MFSVFFYFSCENKQLYADTIRHLRMSELSCESRVRAVQAGLASIVPLPLLALMTPSDLQLRTCGIATLDIDFLKVNQNIFSITRYFILSLVSVVY